MNFVQQQHFIPYADERFYAVDFAPKDSVSDEFYCLFHPFFEEKKNSHRCLIESAQLIASKGYRAKCVDLLGWGDSTGECGDYALNHYLEQIQFIIEDCLKQEGVNKISIVATRFSAFLILQFLVKYPEVKLNKLIMIDPVLNGEKYLKECFRQMCVRKMMLTGSNQTNINDLKTEAIQNGIEFDAYWLSKELIHDLLEIPLSSLKTLNHQSKIIQYSAKPSFPKDTQASVEEVFNASKLEVKFIKQQPFYQLVDHYDYSLLKEVLEQWCN